MIKLFLFVLVLLASALAIPLTPVYEDLGDDPSPFQVTIKQVGETTTVEVELRNYSKNSQRVLWANTFLDNSPVQKVEIRAQKEEKKSPVIPHPRFLGIRKTIDTENLRKSDFVDLAPGAAIQRQFNVAELHPLKTEHYRVTLAGSLHIASPANKLIGKHKYIAGVSIVARASRANEDNDSMMAEYRKTRHQCNKKQSAIINKAKQNCVQFALQAQAATDDAPSNIFSEYFGASDKITRTAVSGVYEKIVMECDADVSPMGEYLCAVNKSPHCAGSTISFTMPNTGEVVYCPAFFKLPDVRKVCSKMDKNHHYPNVVDKVGATIHEVSHLWQVGDTRDWAYGYKNMIALLPNMTITNADTYSYFASAIAHECQSIYDV